jgi:hypothetical protein
LAQDLEARRPIAIEGELIDTATACPPLTPEEERQYNELVEAAKREKEPEAEKAKEAAAAALVVRTGVTIEKARAVIAASTQGELGSWDMLHFDDDDIGEVSVAEILADLARFHGETLADPLEGRTYGQCKAQLYWNQNNAVVVHSFAHGGRKYTLCHDPDYVQHKVEEAGEDAPRVLAEFMCHGDKFDPVDRERLRNRAAKLGKVGKRTVNETIKGTGQQAKRAAAEAARSRGESRKPRGSRDNREELVLLAGERPKALLITEARLRLPANISAGAIVARGQAPAVLRYAHDPVKIRAGQQDIELPSGSAYLTMARPEHLQAQLDRLFAFAKVSKSGEQYATDCPADIARHVLANANFQPVYAISRTPVLRRDGSVLDQPGYDLATGIFYAPEESFPPLPDNPSQDDARAALERLRWPFREFPFVSEADRDAVAAGETLTLFTRHLYARAPGFAHNAVEAGSGKTKLFDTVAIIALGTGAPLLNADILDDETELKKVLTTLTMAAAPLAVFDNVVRGGRITSPGLSNYLTATVYGDRLLGSNTEVKAATCTVIGMTGNGIEVSGDNTRRILRIDLDAGAERPETRQFDFDSEVEARQDRAELVVAALTILRAHALAGWPAVPGRAELGSFEDWDGLVAGAIVYAGGADIVSLLEKTRAADPERDSLAEVLRMLQGVGADEQAMKVGDIIRAVNAAASSQQGQNLQAAVNRQPIDFNNYAEQWQDLLGRMGRDGRPNERMLGHYLTKNAGRIVGGMQLLRTYDKHDKVNHYRVKMCSDADAAGKAGVCGVSDSPFRSDETKTQPQEGCGNPSNIKGYGSDRTAQTPQNHADPRNPAPRHPNGHNLTCAQCQKPFEPAGGDYSGVHTGEHVHFRCLGDWYASQPTN